jgi:hypothetical protein
LSSTQSDRAPLPRPTPQSITAKLARQRTMITARARARQNSAFFQQPARGMSVHPLLVLRFSHLIQLICLRIAGPAVSSRSKVKRLTDSEH